MASPRARRRQTESACRLALATLAIAFAAAAPSIAQEIDSADPEAFLVVDPDAPLIQPARSRLDGVVAWRATPLLLDEMDKIGLGGGWYRRTFMVHDPDTGRYIGEDFAMAKARGMDTLLTAVGSPAFLSPCPERTENEYGTGLPQFARFMPTDPVAWADFLLAYVARMETDWGVVPDSIELWNEIERVEWCSSSLNEYLEFYRLAAARIRAARPRIKLGGPGLAGYRSTMEGTESALLALLRHATEHGSPLDFVSWHHYAPGSELRFSQMPHRLRALGAALGAPQFEAAITEWNIAPSAEGALGPDFDGSHAAANLLGFYAAAVDYDLDRNYFFLDRDEENDRGLTDFLGESLGAITKHGLHKPVARVADLMLDPAFPDAVAVEPDADEYSVSCYASRSGNRLRIFVGNDVVTGTWTFTNYSRMFGMEPSWLQPRWLAAGGPRATLATLMAQELTQQQAEIVLAFMPYVLLADRFMNEPRPVRIRIAGSAPFQVSAAVRFTDLVNDPAVHRASLLPYLQAAFDRSMLEGCVACAALLTVAGYPVTSAEVFANLDVFFVWTAQIGVPYGIAVQGWKTFQDVRRDRQLADADLLNSLPETALQVETAAQAGVSISGRDLFFPIDPDAVLILELEF